MSRLETIVARNREAQRVGLRKLVIAVTVVVGLVVIVVLMTCTDLGKPNVPPAPPSGPPHVDGVYIGKPRATSPSR